MRRLPTSPDASSPHSGQPLVVRGSMGQEREHPLLPEQRQQRALLTRTLAQLKLPDIEPGAEAVEAHRRSVAARRAALSRWQPPSGRGEVS